MNQSTFDNASKFAKSDRRLMSALGHVKIDYTVPHGYVKDIKTGVVYRLDTWLERVLRGFSDDARGQRT